MTQMSKPVGGDYPIFWDEPIRRGPSALETYMGGSTFNFSYGGHNLVERPIRIVPVSEPTKKGTMSFGPVLRTSRVELTHGASIEGFEAKVGQTMVSTATREGAFEAATTVYYGIGRTRKVTRASWRKALTSAFQRAKTLRAENATLELPANILSGGNGFRAVSAYTVGRTIAEIGSMVLYGMNVRKTEAGGLKKHASLKNIDVRGSNLTEKQIEDLKRGLAHGQLVGASVCLARNLGNEPENHLTPKGLLDRAYQVANDSGGYIKVTKVLDRKGCTELGMGFFMAVARGSAEEPYFFEMTYDGPGTTEDDEVIALIGKSVMFDTGGVSLKPADAMKGMKYDMCGGATVIAVAKAAAALRLPIRIKVYCAATTNRTGSNAALVDDVVTCLDGTTAEIKNTDAEGRLCLRDSIAYARKFGKVSRIIDVATLTGAIVVALADIHAGGFTNNKKWFEEVKAAGDSVGERIWPMPADDEYDVFNESDIADISNTGGRWGGAVTAAKFVLKGAGNVPIVHLDIAGTAFRERAFEADPKGGTGFGVRTLVALLEAMSKKKPAKKAKKTVRRAKR